MRPLLSRSAASASASLARSRVWITSNSATASLTLLVCSGPDQMQFQIGKSGFQRRKFALRFLHPVFAEQALAGGQGFADTGFRHGLGHRHQLCGWPRA